MSTATETKDQTEGREGLASMIRRVKIRNYKSIKYCDVELKLFTILVGRNGSGKSNFLDALRLISEGLRDPESLWRFDLLPWAGVADKDPRMIPDTEISLELCLDSGLQATYEVVLGVRSTGYVVLTEQLKVHEYGMSKAYYRCELGKNTESSVGFMPPALQTRLYLGRASAVPEFRPVYDALTSSAFYDLVPSMMRNIKEVSSQSLMMRDGSNIASIYGHLETVEPDTRDRLLSYLAVVVPEFAHVRREMIGPYSTLVFERQQTKPSEPRSFYIDVVSDGTLRALGILVAINQLANDGRPIRLVGIEEPETALHPAASGALMDAFREAATHTQVLITTHSADLLDRYDPDEDDHLLLATMNEGATRITEIDPASKRIIRKHLDTAGGLLRMDQLEPEPADLERQYPSNPTPGGNGES